MIQPIDIIIPTCKMPNLVQELVREIRDTAGIEVNVIATCQPESAAVNRNCGLEEAQSELRIMLDDDITGLPQGWAVALLKVLEDHPKCVMVSPQLMTPSGEFGVMMGCPSPKSREAGIVTVEGPHLLTACIAVRKDDLRFDEKFVGSGWEDNDYCNQQNERYPGCTRSIRHDVQVIHRNEMKHQARHFLRNRRYYLGKWRLG